MDRSATDVCVVRLWKSPGETGPRSLRKHFRKILIDEQGREPFGDSREKSTDIALEREIGFDFFFVSFFNTATRTIEFIEISFRQLLAESSFGSGGNNVIPRVELMLYEFNDWGGWGLTFEHIEDSEKFKDPKN